jgi:hypothetical protein
MVCFAATDKYFSPLNAYFVLFCCWFHFFDAPAGLGLVAVLISQIVALLFNFNHALIRNGTYTYNSLMLGHWYFL